MARPLIPLDEDRIAELAFKGARNSEIGFLMGVDDETIKSRFSRLLDKKRAERRVWLRESQNRKVEQGDTSMMIWLGKNELDQTDKAEQQHSGNITIQVVYEDIEPNRDDSPPADQYSPQSRPSPLL